MSFPSSAYIAWEKDGFNHDLHQGEVGQGVANIMAHVFVGETEAIISFEELLAMDRRAVKAVGNILEHPDKINGKGAGKVTIVNGKVLIKCTKKEAAVLSKILLNAAGSVGQVKDPNLLKVLDKIRSLAVLSGGIDTLSTNTAAYKHAFEFAKKSGAAMLNALFSKPISDEQKLEMSEWMTEATKTLKDHDARITKLETGFDELGAATGAATAAAEAATSAAAKAAAEAAAATAATVKERKERVKAMAKLGDALAGVQQQVTDTAKKGEKKIKAVTKGLGNEVRERAKVGKKAKAAAEGVGRVEDAQKLIKGQAAAAHAEARNATASAKTAEKKAAAAANATGGILGSLAHQREVNKNTQEAITALKAGVVKLQGGMSALEGIEGTYDSSDDDEEVVEEMVEEEKEDWDSFLAEAETGLAKPVPAPRAPLGAITNRRATL